MDIIYGIFIFLLGALFASFAHLLGYRIPRNEPSKNRSYCDHCQHQLRLIDVFPIVGYLVNMGKCHYCKEKISIEYPIFELFGGIIFVISYLIIGDINLELLLSFILMTVLMTLSISDLYYHEVIDRVWIIGLLFIMTIQIIQGNFLIHLVSSFGLFSILIVLALLGRYAFKKEALGGGDIKLFLMIGFALTFVEGLLAIFLASFIGLIYAIMMRVKTGKEMAFIPMISIGVLLVFWFGQSIIQWYLNLLGV